MGGRGGSALLGGYWGGVSQGVWRDWRANGGEGDSRAGFVAWGVVAHRGLGGDVFYGEGDGVDGEGGEEGEEEGVEGVHGGRWSAWLRFFLFVLVGWLVWWW